MLLSAFDDKEYMAWYKQEAAMSNPEIEYGAWLAGRKAAEARATELAAQLATAQARIAELESQARDNNRRMMTGQPYIVHTRPTEWDTETPLGQTLDGIGDEVEP